MLRVTAEDFDLILPQAECIGDKLYDGRVRSAAGVDKVTR